MPSEHTKVRQNGQCYIKIYPRLYTLLECCRGSQYWTFNQNKALTCNQSHESANTPAIDAQVCMVSNNTSNDAINATLNEFHIMDMKFLPSNVEIAFLKCQQFTSNKEWDEMIWVIYLCS